MTGTIAAAAVIAAIALPLALAAGVAVARLRATVLRLAPWAAVPAFALAVNGAPHALVHADSLVFGMTLGVADAVTRGFLVLTASVWLAAGVFGGTYMDRDPHRARFWGCFLASCSGNIGLVLAQDAVSFYLFFVLMTLAAYGLVAHTPTAEARRAGRVYLVMALIGEMLLFAALLMIVGAQIDLPLHDVPRAVAAARDRGVVVGLLLAGFGIKAGALVLHVWLPLAHPVAPTPASAVLSGSMINAGLLGWVRFLPLGIAALPGPGLLCVAAGLTAAFYAVVVGLTQREPKTILAYSSVSQMGFMTAALGAGLAAPPAAAPAVSAILFYAMHHALAKAALFLGVGVAGETGAVWPRRLVLLGLVWAALDLAGAPLSSGALAKVSLKSVMTLAPWGSVPIGALLSVGAVGSTLVMARLLYRVRFRRDGTVPRRGLWSSWVLLLALDLLLFVRPPIDRETLELLVRPANVLGALWPVMTGAVAFVLVRHLGGKRPPIRASIPAGDLVVLFELALGGLQRLFAAVVLGVARIAARLQGWGAGVASIDQRWGDLIRSSTLIERSLARFEIIGLALLLWVLLGVSLVWFR
ncbi:MAG TPA: complex I subunit 5 family protein [Kofleriaceae bacterium]